MGNMDSAANHFQDAVDFSRQAGARAELAWSCCNLAEALLAVGTPTNGSRAGELLDQSLPLATDLDMNPLVQKVEQLEGRRDETATPSLSSLAGLTRREIEVLRLIAAGKSNPEIGRELVISVRTAANHVANILNKTGASNRVEAATYATRHGLT